MRLNNDPIRRTYRSERTLFFAFLLNTCFTLIEIIGGILTNSLAILSNALHDMSDDIALALAWYYERDLRKGRTTVFTYSFDRFSLAGAIITTFILLSGSVFLIALAVIRLSSPEPVIRGGMLALAVMAIVINGIAALRMRRKTRMSDQLVMIHLIEDLFGWVAVLTVSALMHLADLSVLDPILSLAVSAFIIYRIQNKLFNTLKLFLQSVPIDLDMGRIRSEVLSIPGISDFHDFRAWSLDGKRNAARISIIPDGKVPRTDYGRLRDACRRVLEQNRIAHLTVEIDSGAG